MRTLWIANPNDEKAIEIADQHRGGDQILAAPVLEQGATRRDVYLSAGEWWDYWSDRCEKSGAGIAVTRELDLSTILLYVRAGAIVPRGPARQNATEPSEEPVTFHVYPGADGRFSRYQDDGIRFAYEHGQFSRIDCSWSESARKLTQARPGGKIPSSTMRVMIHTIDNGTTKTVYLANHPTVIDL